MTYLQTLWKHPSSRSDGWKARLLPLSSGHDAGEPAGNMSVPRDWRKVYRARGTRHTSRSIGRGKKLRSCWSPSVRSFWLASTSDLGAMFASVVVSLDIAPIAFAALVFFVWGALQTTAELYAKLYTTSRTRTTGILGRLRSNKSRPPDYEAWRHVIV